MMLCFIALCKFKNYFTFTENYLKLVHLVGELLHPPTRGAVALLQVCTVCTVRDVRVYNITLYRTLHCYTV